MKWSIYGVAAALFSHGTSAFKHNHLPRRYRHLHHQRDIVTDLTVVTATVDGGLVIVDQYGHALTTICASCFTAQASTKYISGLSAVPVETLVSVGQIPSSISIDFIIASSRSTRYPSRASKTHTVSSLRTSSVHIPGLSPSLPAATPSIPISSPKSPQATALVNQNQTETVDGGSTSTASVSEPPTNSLTYEDASSLSLETQTGPQFFDNTTSTSSGNNITFTLGWSHTYLPTSPKDSPSQTISIVDVSIPQIIETPAAATKDPAVQSPSIESTKPPKGQPNQPLTAPHPSIYTITLSKTTLPTFLPSPLMESASSSSSSSPQQVTTSNSTQIPQGFGLSYSPYAASGTCKTPADIEADISRIVSSLKDQYAYLRLYGTDCDQTLAVGRIANSHGLGIFAGIWSPDTSTLPGETQYILDALNSGVNIVAIGIANEAVSANRASLSSVLDAVQYVRSTLRSAKYDTSVVAIDTFLQIQSTPSLCQLSDFPAANAHAFFDPTVAAPAAGVWVLETATKLKQVCGRDVLISESGWPRQGEKNGFAVPGMWEQSMAVSGIRRMLGDGVQGFEDGETDAGVKSIAGGVVLYTAFDDQWKKDGPGTFGAEKYWGLLGLGSS